MIQTDDYLEKLFSDFYKKLEILNMNQSHAAEEIKITRSHLNKVINKRTDPSLKLIQKMEKFCYEK